MRGTFAFAAVVVRGYGLFLEEILHHFEDVPVILVAEIDIDVPDIIKGDGLVAAGAADNFGQDLPRKEICHN